MNRNLDFTPDDIEYSVFSFIVYILKKWRLFLVLGIIGCFIGAGVQIVRVNGGALVDEEEDYQLELLEYRNKVDSLTQTLNNTQIIAELEAADLENSVYLNLDSRHVWSSSVVFNVSIEDDILGLYANTVINPYALITNAYLNSISGKYLPVEDRIEMIGTDELKYWDELVQIEIINNGRMIKIDVKGASQEFVSNIMDYLKGKLLEKQLFISNQISPHSISEYSNNSSEALLDQQIVTDRQTLAKSLENHQSELVKTQSDLNELLRQQEPTRPGKHILRFAVVFGIVFVIMAMAVILIKYISSGIIYNETFVHLYDAPLLGMICAATKSKNCIDRAIAKLEYKDFLPREKEIDSISAFLAMKAENGQVCIGGNASAEDIQEICDALKLRVPNSVAIIPMKDALTDIENVRTVKMSSGIVLVERIGVSKMQAVLNEAEKMISAEVPVLGWILLE